MAIPPDPVGGKVCDGSRQYSRPALAQPLRPAVQELVDAALTGRGFDVARVPQVDSVCMRQRGAAAGL